MALVLARQAEGASFYLAKADAPGYGLGPLHLCPTPDSRARPAFADDLLAAHLDALAARQQDDGGWPIAFAPEPGRGLRVARALDARRARDAPRVGAAVRPQSRTADAGADAGSGCG